MSTSWTIGLVVFLAVIGILVLWAVLGSVREIFRDGYGRREYDPDYDTRRPEP